MNYNLFNILFLLIFSTLNAQCDSGYTYNASFPSHINVLDNSTCFYNTDLDALMDLISTNNLPFTSPLQDCYVDINGNVYVVGNINACCTGAKDLFLYKYDTNGQVLWQKSISGN